MAAMEQDIFRQEQSFASRKKSLVSKSSDLEDVLVWSDKDK